MTESNKAKYFTRGGQITFHNWRMLFQINSEVAKIYIISLLLLSLVIIWFITPFEIMQSAYYVIYSKLALILNKVKIPLKPFHVTYQGNVYIENATSFLSQWQFVENAKKIYQYMLIGFFIALGVSLIISLILVKWLTKKGHDQTASKFIRGAELKPSKQVAKQIIKDSHDSNLTVDGFPLLKGSEVQHILIHGTTGAGKGQLLQKLLDAIRQRGDRVILYDKGCSLTPIYYREGRDILLNPFDQRCANWDLWAEAISESDFENMAESLIPLQGENDPFWVNAARTIFSSVAYKMKGDKDRSIEKLLKVLITSELTALENYLSGTQAATLASDKIEKTAISIRSVISTYLKSLRFLKGLDKSNRDVFSIRDWIQKDQDDQWLFISSNGENHSSLRPLISLWLAQASLSLLSLPENRDRRIWFIVDELPSLHRLPQLPETIAEVRKFGGCFVLGMQNFAQLEKTYTRNSARDLFDLLNTRFFFRSPSADMARIVSQELGSQELDDMRENYSYGANRVRDGISIGRQRVIREIVAYSEIMSLPDLACYLRLPTYYPVVKLSLMLQSRDKIAPHFIERNSDYQKIANEKTQSNTSVNDEEIIEALHKKQLKKHAKSQVKSEKKIGDIVL